MERLTRVKNRPACAIATRGLLGVAAATLLANPSPAHAQQSAIDAMRAQIADLMERLSKMEADAKKASEGAAKAAPAVTAKEKATISALLQGRADVFFSEDGPTTPRQVNTLRLRRGEVRVTGSITPRISGTIMIDPTKQLSATSTSTVVAPPATAPPGTQPTVTTTTNLNQASNILQEMQLSYLLTQNARGAHYTDIGQFKIPIGYEGDLVSSSAIQTIDRALMFTVRDPFAGGYGDIRETGLQLRGTAGPVDYRLGVFNGLGERQNTLAASDSKAFIGRLVFKPASVEGLQLGVSAGVGDTGTPKLERSQFNLFGVYKKDKITFQSEYLQGDAQLNGGSVRDVRSYYASLGYLFRPKLEGVVRYDTFDTDRNNGGLDLNEATVGLNYYIKGNNAKIQANIVRRSGIGTGALATGTSSTGIGGLRNDFTQLKIQGQVAF